MFISHKYRFIFVRTEKTAGTSLSIALMNALTEGSEFPPLKRPAWARYSPIHHGALTRNLPTLFGLHPHATARQSRAVVGRAVFDGYFKFAIERNPWDRQVSLYYQRKRKKPGAVPNFDRDMRNPLFRMTEYVRMDNWGIYAEGERIIVDRVLRYEELDETLPALFSELGVTEKIALPRARSGHRDEGRHYRDEYSPATRDLVARWYRREIEAFGYAF